VSRRERSSVVNEDGREVSADSDEDLLVALAFSEAFVDVIEDGFPIPILS
jgi:hypothetical protein